MATAENGVVSVGPRWTGTWWSDGYGDYIKHFFEGMAAVPEWAPAEENHLLRSSSVVQSIHYEPTAINYRTYDEDGQERFRLKAKPKQVKLGNRVVAEQPKLSGESWRWQPLAEGGGVMDISRRANRDVVVEW